MHSASSEWCRFVSAIHLTILHRVYLGSGIWLYSGRAVHFWTKGAPILTKIFLVLQYMKKLRSSPSEHFLVIRVCQKCQKCKISEKPGFWRNCGYISKTVRSIFMIFWLKTPLTINKRRAKKIFQNFLPFLRNNQLCKNWNFSKTCFFIFLKFKT